MPQLLKSLELQGYKTFASRSVMEFAGNITAIVGPNGSGKSNVADAMRWVLGEQSYSLMRAKKTEDIIFSGSERRARAGMASATVVFNNEDNWLPIDYSEVSITRRAYRDGQNDYLLNGQRVRLKDINELLGKSGLAERTYTVIGQGLVDAALSLNPEERRRFFEEAAGIQLYRSRRQEAINRLDSTRRNMDRALDILSEIKPRLRSLERQAKRVKNFDRISADLQLLLRDWYGYHWHNTQQEIKFASEILKTREDTLEKMSKKQGTIEKRIAEERLKLHEIREKLNQWHGESSGFHREREQILRRLAVMDERQRSLQNQRSDIDSNMNRLLEEQKSLNERHEKYQEECDQLETEVTEAKKKAEDAKELMKKRLADRAVLDNKIRTIRKEITKDETSQVRQIAGINELNNRLISLNESKKTGEENLRREEKKLAVGEKILAGLKEELKNAEEIVQELAYELENHQGLVFAFEKEIQETKNQQNEAMLSLTRAKAQLKVLDDAEHSFSGMSQGPQTLLKSAKAGRLQGKYRALNTVLDVPAEYEVAIAAYLGEIIDAVLLNDNADVMEALRLLEEKEKGRTTLLPAKNKRAKSKEKIKVPYGCIGRVSELIHFAEFGEEYFKILFGNLYLVEDRGQVRSLQDKLPPSSDIVTLNGEIFRHDGVIIAGKDQGKSGVISRPRQKRELLEKIVSLESLIKKLGVQLEIDEKKLQRMLATTHKFQEKLKEEQLNRSRIEKSNQQVEVELQQAHERLQFHRDQRNSLINQVAKAEGELNQLQEMSSFSDELINKHRKDIRELQRELNNLPVSDLQREENHWRTSMAVADRALQDAEQRVSDFRTSRINTEQRIDQLKKRLENQIKQSDLLITERSLLMEEEKAVKKSLEQLNEKIDPAEEELQKLEAGYTFSQDDLRAAQKAASNAERNATQAQSNLSRQRDSLQSLRDKIEEDFGLVAFTFEKEVSGQETIPFDGLVKQLPVVTELPKNLNEDIRRNRALMKRLGAINPEAKNEYNEVFQRDEFLTQQLEDLTAAELDLQEIIKELNELMKKEFKKTFDAVAVEFEGFFTHLFGGGTARLNMTDEENPAETGIEIHAKLPGRREQGLNLLSGGERSLTAVALVFSLLKVSPTPFCVLDEVDAMLDESNVGRFCDLLKELGDSGTQFIVITHNRGTIQASDVIFGVTKGLDSVSQLVSLRLDEVSDDMIR
ncbi:MAG: chromosome segregation protein SMC [Anaerolineaceae bacterium]|nr:chromosome segregation protein SMC [Anaerolineaceae bacterium]